MDAVETHDEQALRTQLEQAREKMDGLVRGLHAVDRELEELSGDRHQYRLLDRACGALEELSEMGAAGLFWDARAAGGDGDDHMRCVRGRVDAFQKHVEGIEGRRQEVLDEIQLQQESADFLEDDLYELKRREEERKLEWIIERDIDPLPARAAVMPWTRAGEDDDRFRKALAASLLLSTMLGVLLPMIDLPLPDPWEVTEVPDRLTSLIRDELPPPSPPVQEPTKPQEPDPEKPLLAEETAPKTTPEKTAESKGILAFREKFSGLAASKAPARLGSDARITSSAEAEMGRPTRNMVATQAPGSSGGINLASLSRGMGGGNGQDMQGVQVTRVTSSIGGVAGEDRPLSSGLAAGRTDEEIQIVFDRHKAALYRLYNRELRRDPTLMGQMVLRIRIEPDGSVSLCQLQSTDMKAPQLASQVVGRVKTFDFGAKDGVPTITILYPIDFLPAT